MIDLTKIKKSAPKKKNRFGEPPAINESGENLEAPEHAPKHPKAEPTSKTRKKARRKTGRTEVFSTRVTPTFLKQFKTTAFKDGMKVVELLEASFEAYKQQKK